MEKRSVSTKKWCNILMSQMQILYMFGLSFSSIFSWFLCKRHVFKDFSRYTWKNNSYLTIILVHQSMNNIGWLYIVVCSTSVWLINAQSFSDSFEEGGVLWVVRKCRGPLFLLHFYEQIFRRPLRGYMRWPLLSLPPDAVCQT
jgi:hypothetical protein